MLKAGAKQEDAKTYVNLGVSQLHIGEHYIDPGQEFTAALKPEFEKTMLQSGHISVVDHPKEPETPESKPEPEPSDRPSKRR